MLSSYQTTTIWSDKNRHKISQECIVELIILAAELVLHKRDQRDIQCIINIHHLFIMLHLIKSNITMRKQCKQQAWSWINYSNAISLACFCQRTDKGSIMLIVVVKLAKLFRLLLLGRTENKITAGSYWNHIVNFIASQTIAFWSV